MKGIVSVVFGAAGAFHLIFPLIALTNAVSMPPPTQISQQPHHERKMGNLPMVLESWERADKMKDKMETEAKSKEFKEREKIYDFIVVGAGTAGSIVATRLSQQYSVLLLESGGQVHINHENSHLSLIMTKHPESDWMYKSIPHNDTCLICPDKKYTFSAGKGLGGSANLNYLETLYEGKFEDYNEWMEATQDPGWGLFMLQPFIKTVKGYLKKKYTAINGESPYYRSTFKALVKANPKLEVQKYSHVNKIILDLTGRAIGVEYEKHGVIKYANVSKEVILSSGVFGSPKILMLSGLGPKKILKKYNITARVELPTGRNFQDRLAIPIGPFFKTTDGIRNESMSAMQDTWNSSTILRMPLVNLNYNLHSKEMSHFFGIKGDALRTFFKNNSASTNSNFMFINVALRRPMSAGEVNIVSNDPKEKPVVTPNFLTKLNQDDKIAFFSEKQLLIDGLEETVRLMEVNPNYKTKFTEVPFPGCESYIFRGFGYWDCYIKHWSITLNHGVGTCAMGSSTSKIPAVVSPELKVYGVPGLRVVDASVIPKIVGTFPYFSVAVLAERAADLIIKDYQFFQFRRAELENSRSVLDPADPKHHSYFTGFNIEKIEDVGNVTAPKNESVKHNKQEFWKKVDQTVQKAYTHSIGSTLNEDDLTPPGEQPSDNLNPSYFPVRPLANSLIFHPLVPDRSPLAEDILQRNDINNNQWSFTSLVNRFFNLPIFHQQRSKSH